MHANAEAKLTRVLLDNPGATSSDLTLKMSWEGQSWHLHFGTKCKRRLALLAPDIPKDQQDAPFFTGLLAEFDHANRGFTVKSDLARARGGKPVARNDPSHPLPWR